MPHQTHGLHHFHKRKRIHKKLEPYPHPNRRKKFLDRSIYVIGLLAPIMTIPQIIKIWFEKNASGLALVTWITYLIVAIFWIIYGIEHKEKPLVFIFSSWIILDTLMIIGIMLYG